MNVQTPYERALDARHARRVANEDKTHARLSRLEDEAAKQVGELANGRCYIWPVGGQYRTGTRSELIAFLIRNRYV